MLLRARPLPVVGGAGVVSTQSQEFPYCDGARLSRLCPRPFAVCSYLSLQRSVHHAIDQFRFPIHDCGEGRTRCRGRDAEYIGALDATGADAVSRVSSRIAWAEKVGKRLAGSHQTNNIGIEVVSHGGHSFGMFTITFGEFGRSEISSLSDNGGRLPNALEVTTSVKPIDAIRILSQSQPARCRLFRPAGHVHHRFRQGGGFSAFRRKNLARGVIGKNGPWQIARRIGKAPVPIPS